MREENNPVVYYMLYWYHNQSKLFSDPQCYKTQSQDELHEAILKAHKSGYEIEKIGIAGKDNSPYLYYMLYWLHNQSKLFSEPQCYTTKRTDELEKAITTADSSRYEIEKIGIMVEEDYV